MTQFFWTVLVSIETLQIGAPSKGRYGQNIWLQVCHWCANMNITLYLQFRSEYQRVFIKNLKAFICILYRTICNMLQFKIFKMADALLNRVRFHLHNISWIWMCKKMKCDNQRERGDYLGDSDSVVGYITPAIEMLDHFNYGHWKLIKFQVSWSWSHY